MSALTTASPRPFVTSLGSVESLLAPFAEPLIRATAGLLLVPHGAQKLFGLFGGYGVTATGQFFESKLGLPASLALVAGLIEFFGGILLAIGFLTRPVAALVAGLMFIALIQVHLRAGFFWTTGGFEYPMFWGLVALAYVLRGGGRYSVDALIGREI
jgi:putative oxidoreductase